MSKSFANKLIMLLVSVLLLQIGIATADESFRAGKIADGAPQELKFWRKLIGQWTVRSETLSEDGSGWEENASVQWNIFWTFGGWGIQDEIISPPAAKPLADETLRMRQINMRIFDPAEQSWSLTWLTPSLTSPGEYRGEASRKTIVLNSVAADEAGDYSRVSFSAISDTGFKWTLEKSPDGERWREVARRTAVKR